LGGDENGSSEEAAGSCAVCDFIAGKQKALLCAQTMGVTYRQTIRKVNKTIAFYPKIR
jgi:hypothetical protein